MLPNNSNRTIRHVQRHNYLTSGTTKSAIYKNVTPLLALPFIRKRKRENKLTSIENFPIEEDSDEDLNSSVGPNETFIDIDENSSDNSNHITSGDPSHSVGPLSSLGENHILKTDDASACLEQTVVQENSARTSKLNVKSFKKQLFQSTNEFVELDAEQNLLLSPSLCSHNFSEDKLDLPDSLKNHFSPGLVSVISNPEKRDVQKSEESRYSKDINQLLSNSDVCDSSNSFFSIKKISSEKRKEPQDRLLTNFKTSGKYEKLNYLHPDDSLDRSPVKFSCIIDGSSPLKEAANSIMQDTDSRFLKQRKPNELKVKATAVLNQRNRWKRKLIKYNHIWESPDKEDYTKDVITITDCTPEKDDQKAASSKSKLSAKPQKIQRLCHELSFLGRISCNEEMSEYLSKTSLECGTEKGDVKQRTERKGWVLESFEKPAPDTPEKIHLPVIEDFDVTPEKVICTSPYAVKLSLKINTEGGKSKLSLVSRRTSEFSASADDVKSGKSISVIDNSEEDNADDRNVHKLNNYKKIKNDSEIFINPSEIDTDDFDNLHNKQSIPINDSSSTDSNEEYEISSFCSPKESNDISFSNIPLNVLIPGLMPRKCNDTKVDKLVFISKNKRKLLKNGSLVARALNVVTNSRINDRLFKYELKVGIKSNNKLLKTDPLVVLKSWCFNDLCYLKSRRADSKLSVIFIVPHAENIVKGSVIVATYPLKVFTILSQTNILAMTDQIEVLDSDLQNCNIPNSSYVSSLNVSHIFQYFHVENQMYYHFKDWSAKSIRETLLHFYFRSNISICLHVVKAEKTEWGLRTVLTDNVLFTLVEFFIKISVNVNGIIGKEIKCDNLCFTDRISVKDNSYLQSINKTIIKEDYVFKFTSESVPVVV